MKDQLGFLTLSEHGDDCSKIARGDFNHDGRPDHAAVLTEITPLEHYADGSPWFRTYVVVFLDLGLPYGQYQAVFVRTDRSKPKLFFLAAISRKGGHDLEVKVAGYSSTEYRWFPGGFKAIEHSAD